MRIAILTTGSKYEDARLAEAAKQQDHQPSLLRVLKCSISVCSETPKVFYEGQDISNDFDIVIPRINIPHTIYGLSVLRQFQAMNVYTSDAALSLELGRDKLRCKQYLLQKNIPVPATAYAHSKNDFDTIIKAVGGPPLILKLVEGTEGTGVFLAKDEKEARNILGSFKQFDARVLAQEYIEESAGTDLRCFVVGNKVVASMKRQSQDGDFRANVALGAHSSKEIISKEEERVALNAAKAIGINVAGVDVIRSKRGPLIIEINVAPDFGGEHGLENTTGVDVAGEIVKFAVEGKKKFDANASNLNPRNWFNKPVFPPNLLPQIWQ